MCLTVSIRDAHIGLPLTLPYSVTIFLALAWLGAIYAYVKTDKSDEKIYQAKKVNLVFISMSFFLAFFVFLFNAIGVPVIIRVVHDKSGGKGEFSVGPAVSDLAFLSQTVRLLFFV